MTLSQFSLLTIILLLTTTTTLLSCPIKPTATTPLDCTNELVSFSPCLSYTAMPPSNSSSTASILCCDNYSAILAAGNGSCLCSLLREPPILGFPLNLAKVLSLSSVCPLPRKVKNVVTFRNYTLLSFCAAIKALPPMPSPEQEYQNNSDCDKLSPNSATDPTSFHYNDSKPLIDERPFLPPPTPTRGFHFGSPQASSATRTVQPWSLDHVLEFFRHEDA